LISLYTRLAIRLKPFQAWFALIGVSAFAGGIVAAALPQPLGQQLMVLVGMPTACLAWGLFLVCIWFHPVAREAKRYVPAPTHKELMLSALLVSVFLTVGVTIGPIALYTNWPK
jgi:hypothetical protein